MIIKRQWLVTLRTISDTNIFWIMSVCLTVIVLSPMSSKSDESNDSTFVCEFPSTYWYLLLDHKVNFLLYFTFSRRNGCHWTNNRYRFIYGYNRFYVVQEGNSDFESVLVCRVSAVYYSPNLSTDLKQIWNLETHFSNIKWIIFLHFFMDNILLVNGMKKTTCKCHVVCNRLKPPNRYLSLL